MLMYWSMYIMAAFASLSERVRKPNKTNHFIIAYLLFIWLVMGFRETGGDWSTYLYMFDIISDMPLVETLQITDPAYGFLNWLSAQLGTGLYGVNIICSAIFLFCLYKFAMQEGKPVLVLAVATPYLITVVAIGYTRQGVAIGIFLYALKSLRNKQVFAYILLVLFAAAFHRSAVITLPLAYFAVRTKSDLLLKVIRIVAIIFACYFIYINTTAQFDLFWAHYVQSNHYVSQGALIRSLMSAAAAVVFLVYRKKWKRIWQDGAVWLILSLAALIAVPLTSIASTAVDRMGLYLIPLQLVTFSRLPLLQRNKNSANSMVLLVLLLYGITLAVWLHLGQFSAALWVPYKSLLLGTIP